MFGYDDSARRAAADLLDRMKVKGEYEKRIESLKAKSRRLIDIAYNRAISDVLAAVGDELSADAKARAMGLRREVRS